MASKVNTDARAGQDTFARLIRQLRKTDAAVVAAELTLRLAVQKHSRACSPARILGGYTSPVVVTVDGRPVTIKSSAFYFQSHDEIEREMNAAKLKAATRAQVGKVEADRKRLHSALTAEERRIARAIPASVRRAEMDADRATAAYNDACGAILRFKPTKALQAADFLTFLAGAPNFCARDDLAACLRNIAAALPASPER